MKTDSMRLDLLSLIQLSRSLTFSRPVSLSNVYVVVGLPLAALPCVSTSTAALPAGELPLPKKCPDRGSPIGFYYPVFLILIFSPSRNLDGYF